MTDFLLPLMLALAYVTGSLPVASSLSYKWAGIDIRKFGTGNPGAANVYRNVGITPGAIVALAGVLQGIGPILLARMVGLDETQAVFVALAAMAGYGWPIAQWSRGGRGVGITLGVIGAFAPFPAAAIACLFLICIPVRMTSVATIASFLALPVYFVYLGSQPHMVALSVTALLYITTRRLWGIWGCVDDQYQMPGLILRRLIFDASPGQCLVGPRIERIGDEAGREPI